MFVAFTGQIYEFGKGQHILEHFVRRFLIDGHFGCDLGQFGFESGRVRRERLGSRNLVAKQGDFVLHQIVEVAVDALALPFKVSDRALSLGGDFIQAGMRTGFDLYLFVGRKCNPFEKRLHLPVHFRFRQVHVGVLATGFAAAAVIDDAFLDVGRKRSAALAADEAAIGEKVLVHVVNADVAGLECILNLEERRRVDQGWMFAIPDVAILAAMFADVDRVLEHVLDCLWRDRIADLRPVTVVPGHHLGPCAP